jgi:hypothetical protein
MTYLVWIALALIGFVAWRLSGRRKGLTVAAVLGCVAALYIAGMSTAVTATSTTPPPVQQQSAPDGR